MARRLTDEERALRAVTERTLQVWASRMLTSVGFRAGHHYDSRFSDPGTKGMPDLIVVGHGHYFQIELKRWDGVLSADQEAWRDDSYMAGVEYFEYRPADWAELVALAESRSGREVLDPYRELPAPKKKVSRRPAPRTGSSPSSRAATQPSGSGSRPDAQPRTTRRSRG